MTRRSFNIFCIAFVLFICRASAQTCKRPQQQQQQQQQQQAQPVCECSKLDECLKNQRDETNKLESECRQACSIHLGPNSTAILDCLSTYETEKLNHKLSMDKCMNDVAGRPCTADGNANEAEKTYSFNSTLIAQALAADPVTKQKLTQIKQNPLMNSYKTCYKTCMKRLRSISEAAATGKSTKQPNCYVQLGCQLENDPTKKSLRKLAKSNCSMQTKMDKSSLKLKLAECLQSAFANPTPTPAVCSKQPSNEL